MAEKGWTSQVATAAGAAAGTGAAQLGLGYGLGVVVWPVTATPDDNVWLGSLGWATWITASATVIGAVMASRLAGGAPARFRGLWQLALATSAAIGALVAVALIALPARSAVRADTFSPQVTAGGYALLGVLLGIFVAYWAVASRPVAANLVGTAIWLWALAVAAIVVELTAHRTSATYLTSWQFAEAVEGLRYGSINWPSGLLTLGAAFLVGIVAAAPAARRGDLAVGATISGAVGPLLVAAAFLALAPQLTGSLGPLESAYLIAPYAVLAGLAGSALSVALGRAAADRRARRAATANETGTADEAIETGSADTTAGGTAAVPAADLATVPPATAPKTKAPVSAGRAKLPTQPAPASATQAPTARSAATPDARSAATPDARSAATPDARSAAAPAARPGSAVEGPAGQPTDIRSAARAGAAAGSGRAPGARSAAAAAPAETRTAPPAARGGSPEPAGTPSPKPAARNGPSAVDPEIAAAARPGGRARPKRPAPAEAPRPKSTVTPPPTDPAIARINPEADG